MLQYLTLIESHIQTLGTILTQKVCTEVPELCPLKDGYLLIPEHVTSLILLQLIRLYHFQIAQCQQFHLRCYKFLLTLSPLKTRGESLRVLALRQKYPQTLCTTPLCLIRLRPVDRTRKMVWFITPWMSKSVLKVWSSDLNGERVVTAFTKSGYICIFWFFLWNLCVYSVYLHF